MALNQWLGTYFILYIIFALCDTPVILIDWFCTLFHFFRAFCSVLYSVFNFCSTYNVINLHSYWHLFTSNFFFIFEEISLNWKYEDLARHRLFQARENVVGSCYSSINNTCWRISKVPPAAVPLTHVSVPLLLALEFLTRVVTFASHLLLSMLWIRTGFNADLDPVFLLKADQIKLKSN